MPDLYGGKICALLDRQHPRDMFDIKDLLENEGITKDVRRAFVVYLDAPMEEFLEPRMKDMKQVYESEFVGMTTTVVRYEDLTAAREECVKTLRQTLDESEKNVAAMAKNKREASVKSLRKVLGL